VRPGANLYTNCVVAIDADTGKPRWHYQEIPNDSWDFDSAYECVLMLTIQKTDIAGTETASESFMPKDYASIYPVKQLLDIVAYLKSSDPQSKPITLRDLF
jgi:alcohol dehydrogenase (cytochrome c)